MGKPLKNIGSASLVVRWPKENAHGKWLLYLMGISSDGLDKVNCSPAGEINPKGVKKVREVTDHVGGNPARRGLSFGQTPLMYECMCTNIVCCMTTGAIYQPEATSHWGQKHKRRFHFSANRR